MGEFRHKAIAIRVSQLLKGDVTEEQLHILMKDIEEPSRIHESWEYAIPLNNMENFIRAVEPNSPLL